MRKIIFSAFFILCAVRLFGENPPMDNAPLVAPPVTLEQESDRFFGEFVKMMTVLGVVLIALILVTWFVRRFMNARMEQLNAGSLIRVVERRMLTPKTTLYVLEVNDRQILMAESHHGVTALGEISEKPAKSAFSKIMDDTR